ncbi:MIP family channel protein [Paenibacillus macerans]|uniref:MIP/aquaporin family protein n=2 Tax=Paenibacillus macerans TaxID=44252 RepID=UPI003D272425
MKKTLLGECLAEFIGTFIFLFIGLGAVVSLVAGGSDITWAELTLTWGFAVMLGVFIAGHVSGAHLNPAVTISLAVWSVFQRRKVIPYIAAQILGAFAGAATVYAIYRNTILAYEQGAGIVRSTAGGLATAGMFSTFPQSGLSLLQAGLTELVITAVLMLVILAVTDGRNGAAPRAGLAAVSIGLTVAVLGISFGHLTGFAMNPARDLGPRLLLLLSGWGTNALGPNLYGLIVPVFGPIAGALAGGAVYHKLIVPFYPAMPAVVLSAKDQDQLAS